MAIALVTQTSKIGSGSSATTDAVDTTGANLLLIWAVTFGDATVTVADSKSNTWTPLTWKTQGTAGGGWFYCVGGSVGSGHTVTLSNASFASVGFLSFSGVSGYNSQESGAGASATTVQAGSLTPSADNCLVVSGLSDNTLTAASIDSSFTLCTPSFRSTAQEGGAMGYIIQTTAGAVNPTWTAANQAKIAANAVFSATGSGGAVPMRLSLLGVS